MDKVLRGIEEWKKIMKIDQQFKRNDETALQ